MADLPRFGATDFFLTQTDPTILREQLRDALATVLGREVLDSDPHMVLASAFLPFMVQGQASADACAKATLRSYAVGEELDRIADATCVVGYLDRPRARPSVLAYLLAIDVYRTQTLGASTAAVTWQASRTINVDGEEVTFSGSGVVYAAFSDGLGEANLLFPVYLRCSVPGASYNELFGDGLNPVEDASASVSDTVTDADGRAIDYAVDTPTPYRCGSSYGGTDAMGDEAFAQLTQWQAKALRVPGSYEYFMLALSKLELPASWFLMPSVDSEGRIIIAWADKAAACAASAGITLTANGAAYDELVGVVKSSLLVSQRAYIYPASHMSPRVIAEFFYKIPSSVSDPASVRDSVEAAFTRWRSEVGWQCGAFISLSELSSRLAAAGAASVYLDYVTYTAIRTYGLRCPCDRYAYGFDLTLTYDGVAEGSDVPEGGSGEEVVP